MLMLLVSAFGGVTLLLATIGLYGVVAQVVTERTQEIGVRMALGARRPQIVLHFMREGLYSGAIGILLGLVAAPWAQKWLSGMLYQVKPSDAGSFGAAAAGILAILSIALWWPARRASQIDPHEALRHE
jgi:putative ABC transport system permease protein